MNAFKVAVTGLGILAISALQPAIAQPAEFEGFKPIKVGDKIVGVERTVGAYREVFRFTTAESCFSWNDSRSAMQCTPYSYMHNTGRTTYDALAKAFGIK